MVQKNSGVVFRGGLIFLPHQWLGEPNPVEQSYYRYHLFFCVNERADGGKCCGDGPAVEYRDYAKQRVKELGEAIDGNVRVNTAGCMNRCGEGPVLVIYPEAVWYRYGSRADIDEIISSHLCNGQVVERLRIG